MDLFGTEIALCGITFSGDQLYRILNLTTRYMLIVLYLLVILGLIVKYRDKALRRDSVILFVNQVFVTYGVYLLIEVQARYAYNVHISIAILAALGLSLLTPKKDRQ